MRHKPDPGKTQGRPSHIISVINVMERMSVSIVIIRELICRKPDDRRKRRD